MEINFTSILRALLLDIGADNYSVKYILRRLHHEGLSVVTRLLPKLGKCLLASLESGIWDYPYTDIKKRKGLPVFLRGFLTDIFQYNGSQWIVRPTPCPVAIYAFRQVCEYAYKLSLPFEPDQLEDAASKFKEIDSTVLECNYDRSFVDAMRKNFETFYPQSRSVSLHDCARAARPGPGTFSGASGSWYFENYKPRVLPHRFVDLRFGMRPNKAHPLPKVTYANSTVVSEVLFVPKDSRGPRTIIREPYSNLQFQMGYFSCLSTALEQDSHHRINFVSQEVNRRLAQESSITKRYATLDLETASDRISYTIVAHLFRFSPILHCLRRFRTPFAEMPNGELIRLKKVSGMGSGLTFPTMALVIHLAICTQVSKALKKPYRAVSKDVYVYGDDILVPVDWYDLAVAALSKCGLAVNTNKCFRHSNFRESCGGDYFFGNDVRPVRFRLPNSDLRHFGSSIQLNCRPSEILYRRYDKRSSADIVGLLSHAHELMKAQLFHTAEFFYGIVEDILGPLPLVTESSGILGRLVSRDVALASLETDNTGTFLDRRYYRVKPKKEYFPHMCPTWLLRQKLLAYTKRQESLVFGWDAEHEVSFTDYTVSVPRNYNVVRCTSNSYACS